jgi:hypothetical protein
MLDQQQLKEWTRKLNLSEQAESIINQIRSSPPARRVGGGAGNVCGRYPSQKMGVTIQLRAIVTNWLPSLNWNMMYPFGNIMISHPQSN